MEKRSPLYANEKNLYERTTQGDTTRKRQKLIASSTAAGKNHLLGKSFFEVAADGARI